jgi:hypothetical protein
MPAVRIDGDRIAPAKMIDRRGDNDVNSPEPANAWRPKMRPRAKILHLKTGGVSDEV